jgi:wyosine [tRNA(Phe)-imidazoG37] synthetase (radical SAM superfamily)
MNNFHIFGPIKSRRLGLSLGINLFPQKICTLDCVYCEAGETKLLTTERKVYTDTTDILNELFHVLKTKPRLDYITFSGIGEPTLHLDLGVIIDCIKRKHPEYKICLITNSTLLYDEKLQDEILPCDLIMPSLDAVSDAIFRQIDRPFESIQTIDIVNGLIQLRQKFKNQLWLEIFFLDSLNDTHEELELLKRACEKIKPDKIQLNSLDRVGVKKKKKKISIDKLIFIQEYLEPLIAEIV